LMPCQTSPPDGFVLAVITKGHDRAYMAVDIADETQAIVDGCYISPPEGKQMT
jgi:hypothetical protein